MPDTWPSTIPHCLIDQSESVGDGRVRNQPDAGPAIVRGRSSAVPSTLTGRLLLTTAQWEALKTFGGTTLENWSLPFLFPDADGDLYRFGANLPKTQRAGPGKVQVSIEFDILP